MPAKRKKKPRQKVEKGLHRLKDWLKKQDPKTVFDLTLNLALAYAGYEVTKDWKGLLIGPIGLKLATTPSTVPSAAGVTTLAVLGLSTFKGFDTEEQAIAGGVPPTIAKAGKICDDFLKAMGL